MANVTAPGAMTGDSYIKAISMHYTANVFRCIFSQEIPFHGAAYWQLDFSAGSF
jgi:hypothetical protein